MIPFVLQLVPACVLIQVCLVQTDPQDSKERKKVVVTYVLNRTGALSFFLLMRKNAVVSVGYEMQQSSPLEGFQKLSNGTHSSSLFSSMCLLKIFPPNETVVLFHLAENSNGSFSSQTEIALGNTYQKRWSK